ncbi:MAG: galactose isomerase [Chloroflexi bacterium RBG_16_48_8]|nr:MAG: galactose isomerase [Chloroflexi bacterium RBG_16_48_8]
MRIIIGSDERNRMTEGVVEELRKRGHEVDLVGPLAGEALTWPNAARRVAEAVAQGHADEGILCCWTGTGVSMAANKVPGVRAALCEDAETAKGARLWNNANVLCLSIRRTSEIIAREILEAWLNTSYKPNKEDDACLKALSDLEQDYFLSGEDLKLA